MAKTMEKLCNEQAEVSKEVGVGTTIRRLAEAEIKTLQAIGIFAFLRDIIANKMVMSHIRGPADAADRNRKGNEGTGQHTWQSSQAWAGPHKRRTSEEWWGTQHKGTQHAQNQEVQYGGASSSSGNNKTSKGKQIATPTKSPDASKSKGNNRGSTSKGKKNWRHDQDSMEVDSEQDNYAVHEQTSKKRKGKKRRKRAKASTILKTMVTGLLHRTMSQAKAFEWSPYGHCSANHSRNTPRGAQAKPCAQNQPHIRNRQQRSRKTQ